MEPAAAPAVLDCQEQREYAVAPTGLLELPDFLLHSILDRLSTTADLLRLGATCSALRALVSSSQWRHITSCAAHIWTPALPRTLAWAGVHCPQVSCRLRLLPAHLAACCITWPEAEAFPTS